MIPVRYKKNVINTNIDKVENKEFFLKNKNIPKLISTQHTISFGGAYWVWMIILFSFIVQAVSFEFIYKKNNLLGNATYKFFLFYNGLIAPIFIGVAVSTFFFGAEFVVDKSNIANIGNPVISQWTTAWHGKIGRAHV